MTKRIFSVAAIAGLVLALAPAARAGRGGDVIQIRDAIASGSPDAIKAELERAEHLVCAACVDRVLPLIDHQNAGVRQVAAWFLARRGVRSALVSQMVARLGDVDSTLARNAADVLGELQMPEGIAPLSAALANQVFSGEARAAMAHALGTIGELRAQTALAQALSAREPEVRTAVLGALRSLRGFVAGDLAIPLIHDGDERVRTEAIYTVGFARTSGAIGDLVDRLTNDQSAAVRKKAAWALGNLGAAAATAAPALAQAASSDPSPLVRSLAAAALGRLSR